MSAPEALHCQEFVELVTEYLEGTLSAEDRQRFEAHIAECDGCDEYIEQMRVTIRAVGYLSEEHIAPHARERLLEAFRYWKQSPGFAY